jgi:hypothetical protein
MLQRLYSAPWLQPDPQAKFDASAFHEIAEAIASVPPGVLTRHGSGISSPVQVPDLIGVKMRQYLDRTGLQRHRGLADLMRYAALNQGLDRQPPTMAGSCQGRNSESRLSNSLNNDTAYEQLYALTKYVYALKAPPNPNLPKTSAERNS